MATLLTQNRTDQLESAYKRNANPSFRPLQKSVRRARFDDYTFLATPSADDDLVLGELRVTNAEILPEECYISSLNGAMSGVAKLEKVDSAGTVTAVSGSATLNDNTVVFPRISGNDTVQLEAGEYLQVTFTTVTAIVATDIVRVEVGYASDDLQ